MSLIGLDLGTTGCKAIVFSNQGRILSQSVREYSIMTPYPHWAEQDAERVWQLAWDTLRQVVSAARGDPPVALALSCQGEAIIPVDRQGRPLRPAILGMDTRTGAENEWLAERFGPENLFQRTGMPLHTINTLPKLLWLQRNEPEIWKTASQFLLYEDFFVRLHSGTYELRADGNTVYVDCRRPSYRPGIVFCSAETRRKIQQQSRDLPTI